MVCSSMDVVCSSGASMRHVWRVKAYSLHLVHLGFRGRERAPMGGGSAKKKMKGGKPAMVGASPHDRRRA